MPTELISLDEPPAEKEAAIACLPDLIADVDRIDDREEALAALKQRERETSTGVGQGIAIPHAGTDAVERPSVGFVRSSAGLDFDSMDDKPAHLVFMILVPEGKSDEHLTILSSLSRSLMHDEVRDGLYDAETPADVQSVMREAIA